MRISVIFLIFIFCGTLSIIAGDKKYPVSEIPDSLKQGMYAVIRESFSKFEIINSAKALYTVHYAVTILNEKAKSMASETLGYDKLTKILSFKGTAYDALGNEIQKLKQSEIVDQSAISGTTLFDDNRLKYANLSQVIYPYTIEFEYEIQRNYLYSVPSFFLYEDDEVATQKVTYQVSYPKSLQPRFKLSFVPPATKTTSGDTESVTWTFSNVRPLKFEKFSNEASAMIPTIKAAPSQFDYDGYKGDMSSWKEYGKWNILLLQGRQELPEATKLKVHEMTKDLKTNEQKARALYTFLQNRTRYVSIQEGIGGMQPFEATMVDNTGYGDCKALSNYMVALLKVAGITGYYTRIKAGEGEDDIQVDFSSHQTNHVIVSVPNGKDTLWMECTDQRVPFGYMGSFTGDRHAIIITEEGGKIVRTPSYSADQNSQTRTADVIVDALGNAKAQVKTTYSGIQYENGGLNFNLDNQTDEQRKWILNNTEIPSFALNTFSMREVRDKIPSAIVKLDLTLSRYASVSGKRIFISPNLMNKTSSVPEKLERRRTAVVRGSNYLDLDTIIFHFPENLYPEFLPAPVKISSRFGEYQTNYQFDEGKLIYIRRMKMWRGTFPKESYNELVDFYKNISKSDNTKVVFLNKT